jgi:TPR repeat protein
MSILSKTGTGEIQYMMKKIKENDPTAICQQGTDYYNKGDYSSAFEYYSKAAKLGDIKSHYLLSVCFILGEGVEKDEKKALYHFEEAAIGGHPTARHNLGLHALKIGRIEKAIKHFMIAACQGHDDVIEVLKGLYTKGRISKENFAAPLRAHQAAVDETKSPQREAAEDIIRKKVEVEANDC